MVHPRDDGENFGMNNRDIFASVLDTTSGKHGVTEETNIQYLCLNGKPHGSSAISNLVTSSYHPDLFGTESEVTACCNARNLLQCPERQRAKEARDMERKEHLLGKAGFAVAAWNGSNVNHMRIKWVVKFGDYTGCLWYDTMCCDVYTNELHEFPVFPTLLRDLFR